MKDFQTFFYDTTNKPTLIDVKIQSSDSISRVLDSHTATLNELAQDRIIEILGGRAEFNESYIRVYSAFSTETKVSKHQSFNYSYLDIHNNISIDISTDVNVILFS